MTHSGGKAHEVGDRGQRYEVTFLDRHYNRRRVLGWSDDLAGVDRMHATVDRHPVWSEPRTVDRKPGA